MPRSTRHRCCAFAAAAACCCCTGVPSSPPISIIFLLSCPALSRPTRSAILPPRLQGCSRLGDDGIAHLVAMPQLRHVLLPAGISDACMATLTEMPVLERVALRGCTRVTTAGIYLLLQVRPLACTCLCVPARLRLLVVGCNTSGPLDAARLWVAQAYVGMAVYGGAGDDAPQWWHSICVGRISVQWGLGRGAGCTGARTSYSFQWREWWGVLTINTQALPCLPACLPARRSTAGPVRLCPRSTCLLLRSCIPTCFCSRIFSVCCLISRCAFLVFHPCPMQRRGLKRVVISKCPHVTLETLCCGSSGELEGAKVGMGQAWLG